MAIMIISPVITRSFDKEGYEHLARLSAYIGYTWMAMLFIFFVLHILFDIIKSIFFIVGLILNKDFVLMTSFVNKYYFFVTLIVSISVCAYGYYEASNLKTERITIYTEKLPKSIKKIKIIQISDLHIGTIVKNKRLKKIIEIIKKENPDLLISTGDLIDRKINKKIIENNELKDIKPPLGKFAVLGNHEFYAGVDDSIEYLKNEGFVVLRGNAVNIKNIINIAGVDDPAGKPFNYIEIAEKDLLKDLPKNMFTILLKHQPHVNLDALEYFDLQLSGHTHGGQIYPFKYLTRIFYRLPAGLVELAKNKFLYTSRGTGTWGPPIRFLSPPEITAIELWAK